MARYGSGAEDFSEEEAALRALRAQREGMIDAERRHQAELSKTTGLEDEVSRKEETRRRAKVEGREVSRREAQAGQQATRQVKLDTDAIERNTQARRRNQAVAQRQKIDVSRAFAGARDPMFAPAFGIQGAQTTQYAMRQQLEGVGSRRARAMQEAMQLGIRPSAGYERPAGAQSRAEAALSAKAAADLEAAQATKAYTNATKRAGATAGEVESALVARESARAKAKAADTELESARSAEAANRANVAAMRDQQRTREQAVTADKAAVAATQKETRGREEVARVKTDEARRTAVALPAQGVQAREQLQLVAAGKTTQMPMVSSLALGRRVPGERPDIREAGFGGTVGTPQGDAAAAQSKAAAAQATEQQAEASRKAAESQRIHNEEMARAAVSAGRMSEAAHIYGNVLGDDVRAAQALRSANLTDFFDKQAKAAGTLGRATRDAGVNFYPLSQAMHRHGALTTEFIAAAARGETTIRELGNQALVTAGKFAGWTLAASAVYGVAGALAQVGQGAIAAQAGTEQAYRVIKETPGSADALKGSFADLAREFNVPIDVAADSVYRMGQVFHDQEEAVEAARASLYSYKTGEVDVATSTRNLIAIVNGFGLSSKELTNVYDQINQAQNRFGISIGDTESGLAKAAGVYKSAGGDLDYLLGLFVAIQKATGRSGTEIGTGIARAVNRIREPISIEKLQAQGIEVDPEDFQKTLQNALKRAATGQVDVQAVATGLFGNQYARLITPVLEDQELLNKALRETSPEAAKGSAQNELAKVLSQVNEQIQAIGTNLAVLGVELERAGAFKLVFGLVKVFGLLLEVVTGVLDKFNSLPEGVRETITVVGQLGAALLLLRKFGGTERLAGTPLSFLAAPQQRQKTFALAGLRESRQQAFNEVERLGRQEFQAALHRDLAGRRAVRFEESPEFRAAQRLPLGHEERVRVEAEGEAIRGRLQRAETDLAEATERTVAGREIAGRTDQDLAVIQKTKAADVERELARRGIQTPRSLDQPNLQGTTATVVPGAYGGVAAGGVTAAGQAAVRQTAENVRSARRYGRLTTAAMVNTRLALGTFGGRELGRSYNAIERVAGTVSTNIGRGTSAIGRAGRSMGSMPGQMRGLISSLGVFDAALLGFLAIEGLGIIADNITRDAEKASAELEKYRGNTEKAQQALRAMKPIEGGPTTDYLADTFNQLKFWETLPKALRGDYEDTATRRNRVNKERADLVAAQDKRDADNAQRAARGGPQVQLTAQEFRRNLRIQQRRLRDGLINREQYEKILDNAQIELVTLLDPTKRQRAKARVDLAEAASQGDIATSYRESLGDLSIDELQTEMQRVAALAESTGQYGPAMRQIAQDYAAAVEKLAGKTDAKSVLALQEAREAAFNAIKQMAQDELDEALREADTEGERKAAYRQADRRLDRITREPRRRVNEAESGLTGAQRRRQRIRQQLEGLGPDAPGGVDPLTGEPRPGGLPGEGRRASLEKQLAQANADVKRFRRNRKKFRQELEVAKKKQAALQDELEQSSFEDRQTGRDITLQLRISRTASGSEQAALQVKFARAKLKDAADTFGKGSREYRQALTELNQARMNAAQQILRDIDAENSLMIAMAGSDPGAQARARTQAERNRLDAMLRRPGKFDPNDVKEQRARLIEADRAQREQAEQEAAQIADLQAQIAQARSGDPVAAARIGVRAAKAALRRAGTRVERLQALLDLINANNALRDALLEREQARTDLLISRTEDPEKIARLETQQARRAIKGTKGVERMKRIADYNKAKQNERNTKIDARVDDINFLLEMDKITREEAAKRLEELAKIKGISKAKKRELLLQAKRLRDEAEGEYDIDIGNLKLPTLYEVRRFVQGGMPSGAGVGAQVYNNQSINIAVRDQSDMDEVSRVLEANLTGENRSTARNMRMR